MKRLTLKMIVMLAAIMWPAVMEAFPAAGNDSVASCMQSSVCSGRDSVMSGGRLVFVPDSLADAWNAFMKANSDSARTSEALFRMAADRPFDFRNKRDSIADSRLFVSFRGDTIPMVLKDRKLGRFNRGLYNYLYIPKGIWSFGLTASYGSINSKDLDVMDLITGVTLGGHTFSIRPYMQYFIRNNLAVGLRLAYSNSKAGVTSAGVDIMDDMNFNLHDIEYKSESYTAAVTLRQYFGITRGGRFGIFNEVELAFQSGNSDFVRPMDGKIRSTHGTHMKAMLNFSPGVNVFIMKNVGFNVSFGVFGFSLKNERQFEEGKEIGNRFSSGANFRFNIFNINFGLAVTI